MYLNPFRWWLHDFEIHLFNWGTHLQLLQKIQTITDAPEGKKHALRAGAWKPFEFEDQGKFKIIYLLENMKLSSVASEGQY